MLVFQAKACAEKSKYKTKEEKTHNKCSMQTTSKAPKKQAELTWAAELRLNFISTQVPRHLPLKEGEQLKVTGSDPAGYDLGDVSQYFGDWD